MADSTRGGISPVQRFVATGGFLGYSPVAPGTVGAFGCAVLMWFLAPEVLPSSHPVSILMVFLSTAALTALAVWAAEAAEKEYGADSRRIVIDEFAGFAVAVLLLPKSLFVFAIAFVLFRAIDIVKPFPAGRAESLPGGLGVVMDDVVAGLYTNLLVRVMLMVRGW